MLRMELEKYVGRGIGPAAIAQAAIRRVQESALRSKIGDAEMEGFDLHVCFANIMVATSF